MSDLAVLSIAYVAKVVSNAVKYDQPLNFVEQGHVALALSEAIDLFDQKRFTIVLPKKTPINQLPAILRLIGRESTTFMYLYRRSMEMDLYFADESIETDDCIITADFGGTPINIIAQLTRSMHFAIERNVRKEETASEAFAVQKLVLQQLADRGYIDP